MFRCRAKSFGATGVVAAVAAAVFVVAGPAAARTISLTNGSGRDIGWTATVADVAGNESVRLLNDGTWGDNFLFSLLATIGDTNTPLTIRFDRAAGSAGASAPPLAIGMEQIVNGTGTDWAGLRTTVSAGASLRLSAPGATVFSISPFTQMTFTNGNTQMDWTGGVLPSGATLLAGSTRGGGLPVPSVEIVGTPDVGSFQLELIPVTASGPVIIPLPAAGWSGLGTMVGLTLAGAVRRRAGHA